MRPLFADPKTDFAFKKIFGTEEHKPLLIALLNGLLELDEAHRVVEVELLSPEQRPVVQGLKNSIVDVKCVDARGTQYVVEMQVLNVEGFEKRFVYNLINAHTAQLEVGHLYPEMHDVVGVAVCDFELWPRVESAPVPMLSRWRAQELRGDARDRVQPRFVFLELPKYDFTRPPVTVVEKWVYFFRAAPKLKSVPEHLAERPFREALEAARAASFTEEEWEAYLCAGIALQDKRGALSLAEKQGYQRGWLEGLAESREEGRVEVLRLSIRKIFQQSGWGMNAQQEALLADCKELGMLERWLDQSFAAASPFEALRDS